MHPIFFPFTSSIKQYKNDPGLLSKEWQDFFKDFSNDSFLEEVPSWPKKTHHSQHTQKPQTLNVQETTDTLKAWQLIQAYRNWGHKAATTDPLGLSKTPSHIELDPATYGFTNSDFNKEIHVNIFGHQKITVKELVQKLYETYCQKIGIEYMHLENAKEIEWIRERFENPALHYSTHKYSFHQNKEIFCNLLKAETFEKFLHVKFPGAKRFGLDGIESLLPSLETILEVSTQHGVREIVMGMSHRGRLAVMTNFLNKPMRYIFALFQGTSIYKEEEGSGDVKYHQGYSSDRVIHDHKIHLSLTANPSHLESVYPVVLGKVRGKQYIQKDHERKRVLGIVLHGDAAFTGQGVVAESLQLSKLPGYTTGGTIHIIANNQIGFTTNQSLGRSSLYCSDTAKIIQAPVIHVNADHPHAVVWAAKLAADYRQQFGKDVIIDLVGYRRYGHNEGDEPTFTQPEMYQIISNHPTVATLFEQRLIKEGNIQESELNLIRQEIEQHLQKEFEASTHLQTNEEDKLQPDWLQGNWEGVRAIYLEDEDSKKSVITGITVPALKRLGQATISFPEQFHLHPKIDRQFKQKHPLFAQDHTQEAAIDWQRLNP